MPSSLREEIAAVKANALSLRERIRAEYTDESAEWSIADMICKALERLEASIERQERKRRPPKA